VEYVRYVYKQWESVAAIRKLTVMCCCEIAGSMWGQCGVLGWAAEILAVDEIYRISVSLSFVTDF
jgi:hypothetical protein